MEILSVEGLAKQYGGFALKNISFTLRPGVITGFIGRNGAGKTTTLKSLLNFVHPDGGEIRFFGEPFTGHEEAVKQRIGFATGGVGYYRKKKLRSITEATRPFYRTWDQEAYRRYLSRFALDEGKTPDQLSEGMRVKYALTLALSHRAELLLLDEPTSGLDPVSREELLEIFLSLAEEEGTTILFSTHITSDLEKCAEDILYLRNGELVGRGELSAFLAQFGLVRLGKDQLNAEWKGRLLGWRRDREGYTGLVRTDGPPLPGKLPVERAGLTEVMVHMEAGNGLWEGA